MKVSRAALVEALSKVEPGLARKEIVEQSSSFVFAKGLVMTFNDEIAVSHPFETGKISGAVKANEFQALLNKVKDEEIELEHGDGELLIKGKRFRSGIRLEAEVSLPIDEIGTPEDWHPIPETFVAGINFCAFSASTDMTKPLLTCLHVNGRHVESSDNFRITRFDMGKKAGESFPEPLLIPANPARELSKYTPTEYGVTKGWIHFRNEDEVIFSCRTMEGKYPKIDGFLSVEGTKVVLPEGMGEVLERAGIFTKADFAQDERVRIVVANDYMMVHGRGETGWFKERMRIEYEGPEVEFNVNPDFLAETLDLLREVVIGDNRLLMQGENFSHVVCLIAAPSKKDE